jgi:hypothetical protein
VQQQQRQKKKEAEENQQSRFPLTTMGEVVDDDGWIGNDLMVHDT